MISKMTVAWSAFADVSLTDAKMLIFKAMNFMYNLVGGERHG